MCLYGATVAMTTKLMRNPSTLKRMRNPVTGKLMRGMTHLPGIVCGNCDSDKTPAWIDVILLDFVPNLNCCKTEDGYLDTKYEGESYDPNGIYRIPNAEYSCFYTKKFNIDGLTRATYNSLSGNCPGEPIYGPWDVTQICFIVELKATKVKIEINFQEDNIEPAPRGILFVGEIIYTGDDACGNTANTCGNDETHCWNPYRDLPVLCPSNGIVGVSVP